MVRKMMRLVARYLAQPYAYYSPAVITDLNRLAGVLKPGDVILVDGNTRFAAVVKFLTQSTWSHAAMYVGAMGSGPDPACVVEADIEQGVRAIPLSEFRGMHIRVVRAAGLTENAQADVARRVVARVGQPYDMQCAFDLACALWPIGQARLASGQRASGANAAICSMLLAQAFEELDYPLLPPIAGSAAGAAPKRRLYVPRDFDLSPFFARVSHFAPLATIEDASPGWLASIREPETP